MQRANSKAIQKMDTKKRTSKKIEGKKLIQFFGEVKQELKKVEWTSKEELKSYTKICLGSIFVFGMLIYFMDLILQGFLNGVHMFVKFFTG